jgi:hypothetical protein
LDPRGTAPDPILPPLTRIEQHLARIATAIEALTPEPGSYQKELVATRTMPPLRIDRREFSRE